MAYDTFSSYFTNRIKLFVDFYFQFRLTFPTLIEACTFQLHSVESFQKFQFLIFSHGPFQIHVSLQVSHYDNYFRKFKQSLLP